MGKTVYLWSYMRPELTSQTIAKVLCWSGLGQIIVIIDGLRSTAEEQERIWRLETIKVVESAMNLDSRVKLWLYSDNIGNTNHVLRVQEKAMAFDEFGIWIEEDINLDLDAYVEIQNQFKGTNSPLLLTGFSQCNHSQELTTKNTLFVPLWGQTINGLLLEDIQRIWRDKIFEENIVKDVFHHVFEKDSRSHPAYFKRVLDYWISYAQWGIRSSRRWDALANYSLWKSGNFAYTTTDRIAHDISYLDFRGMNQRKKPGVIKSHRLNSFSLGNFEFCIDCERIGSRQERSNLKRAGMSLSYRSKKTFNALGLSSGLKQWYHD